MAGAISEYPMKNNSKQSKYPFHQASPSHVRVSNCIHTIHCKQNTLF
jgi:hypothetical protein